MKKYSRSFLASILMLGFASAASANPVVLHCGTIGHEDSLLIDYLLSLDVQNNRFLLLDSDGKNPVSLKILSTGPESDVFTRVGGFDFTYDVPRALLERIANDGNIIEDGSDDIGGPTSEYCVEYP